MVTLDFLAYCGKGMFTEDHPGNNMPTTERIPAVLMDGINCVNEAQRKRQGVRLAANLANKFQELAIKEGIHIGS